MTHLEQIANSYESYKYAFDQGQISSEEYVILLKGLEVEKSITLNAEELHFKEQLNMAINAAISTASLLG